jgi:hypothetical protein
MGWGSYGGFGPYVSKAEKIRRTEKVKIKLTKKKGVILEPITLDSQVSTITVILQSGMGWKNSYRQCFESFIF